MASGRWNKKDTCPDPEGQLGRKEGTISWKEKEMGILDGKALSGGKPSIGSIRDSSICKKKKMQKTSVLHDRSERLSNLNGHALPVGRWERSCNGGASPMAWRGKLHLGKGEKSPGNRKRI